MTATRLASPCSCTASWALEYPVLDFPPVGLEREIKGEKALLRRKVLQPLPGWPPQTPLSSAGAAAVADAGRAAEGWPALRPERPLPEQRQRPPLSEIGFPAQLRLRGPREAPCPPGPWSDGCGEVLVLPLEIQRAVRRVGAVCGAGRPLVTDGSLLTVWTIVGEGAGGPHLLEPLAARRVDRTLAVEPIELIAERQAKSSSEGDDPPLRYGEGFRLRAADSGGVYLGHTAGAGLRWVCSSVAEPAVVATASPTERVNVPPHGTRFAAHGGELGCPLLLGRPLSLQRLLSPAPTPEDSEEDFSSSSDSDASGSSAGRAARRRRAQQRSSAAADKASRYATEVLFSRVADVEGGVFPVALLPPLERPVPC